MRIRGPGYVVVVPVRPAQVWAAAAVEAELLRWIRAAVFTRCDASITGAHVVLGHGYADIWVPRSVLPNPAVTH